MSTGALQATVGGEFDQSASNGYVISGVKCTGEESRLQDCAVEEWKSERGGCDLRFGGVLCERK